MKASDYAKLHGLWGDDHVLAGIRRMEEERVNWLTGIGEASKYAGRDKTWMAQDFADVQSAKQIYELHKKNQAESIRKMLDPLAGIRSSFLSDGSIRGMSDEISKPFASSDPFSRLLGRDAKSIADLITPHSAAEVSLAHTQRMWAETSVSAGLQQTIKSFEDINKHWAVPPVLLGTLSPLKAWEEQFGRLSLPVIDLASAASLAKMLGREGIESQLAALGINPDGSLNANFVVQEEGIGLSRKAMELMTLLGFILAVLVPIYQELSSAQWQASVDKKLDAQADALEGQRKMIEALTKLVERGLVQETKRQEERFVVRDRVAEIRSKPAHGSSVVGKLLPQEVVRPVSEEGKWIEIEYYHWLHQEYQRGWALKKYFLRVGRPEPTP